jgi:hypothetical protein
MQGLVKLSLATTVGLAVSGDAAFAQFQEGFAFPWWSNRPLTTGRSVSVSGVSDRCETPARSCFLATPASLGNACSCPSPVAGSEALLFVESETRSLGDKNELAFETNDGGLTWCRIDV